MAASSIVTADSNGAWETSLSSQQATPVGMHHILSVTSGANTIQLNPVYIGDVWLCSGQSNMNFLMRPNLPWSEGVLDWSNEVAAAGDSYLKVFTVVPEADCKPLDDVHGTWRPDTTNYAGYFSAIPYLLARELRENTAVPIGVIVACLGSTSISCWIDTQAQETIPDAQYLLDLHESRRQTYTNEIQSYYQTIVPAYRAQAVSNQLIPTYAAPYDAPSNYPTWRYQPGGLYNGMLAPLERFPVKGVAWYQGESDSLNSQNYFEYLSVLIDSWRTLKEQPELPFLVVQLSNFDPVATGSDSNTYTDAWAGLREAQADVLSISNTALIVTADCGDSLNIHYRNKQPVAYRLGLAALKAAYGQTNLVSSGPLFKEMHLEGSEIEVSLTETGTGLTINTNYATGLGANFEVAGPEFVFFPAQCRLGSNSVFLSSTNIPEPVYARYAYDNDPKLILYNAEGLPAAPFSAIPELQQLACFTFNQSNLMTSISNTLLTEAKITLGAGITATGYNATRGTPPASFFIRTSSTPDSEQAAVSSAVYMEVRLTAANNCRMVPALMNFSFDIARSTTSSRFWYAVRSSADGFSNDLCQAEITTANETFSTVPVPAPASSSLQNITYRIYFWDNVNDSSRVFRLDSFNIAGQFLFPASGYKYEAENEITTVSAGDSFTNFPGSDLSGGYGSKLNANATNDYIQYKLYVPQTGAYTVSVRYRKSPARGIFQASLEGFNYGSPVDCYGSVSGCITTNLGTVNITTAGYKQFKFTVVGKSAGSTDYDLAFDCFDLIKN